MPLTAPKLTQKSSGEQMMALKVSLVEKANKLKAGIEADEEVKDQLLNELKALTAKLEEVQRRLGKLNAAKKQYTMTLQEVNFSMEKVEETGVEIGGRVGELDNVGVDKAAEAMKKHGLKY